MDNSQKYDNAFIEAFGIDKNCLDDSLKYNSIPSWDSVGHMSLISALEDGFDIMMEMDDIVEFESYTKGKDILAKYEIKL